MYLGVLLFGKQRLSMPTQKSLDPGDVLSLSRNGFTARTADPFCHSLQILGLQMMQCTAKTHPSFYLFLSFLPFFFFCFTYPRLACCELLPDPLASISHELGLQALSFCCHRFCSLLHSCFFSFNAATESHDHFILVLGFSLSDRNLTL